MLMNGDIIRFHKMICSVSIQGYQGAYEIIDGLAYNRATGKEGYLTDLATGNHFRAKWDNPEVLFKARDVDCFGGAIGALKAVGPHAKNYYAELANRVDTIQSCGTI
jgi:hypothetical protein